nr:hypothetical protein [Spirochaetaceae bacterium]
APIISQLTLNMDPLFAAGGTTEQSSYYIPQSSGPSPLIDNGNNISLNDDILGNTLDMLIDGTDFFGNSRVVDLPPVNALGNTVDIGPIETQVP